MCVFICARPKALEYSGVTSEITGGQWQQEQAHMPCPSHLARLCADIATGASFQRMSTFIYSYLSFPDHLPDSVLSAGLQLAGRPLHSRMFVSTGSRPIHLAMFASRCSVLLFNLPPLVFINCCSLLVLGRIALTEFLSHSVGILPVLPLFPAICTHLVSTPLSWLVYNSPIHADIPLVALERMPERTVHLAPDVSP